MSRLPRYLLCRKRKLRNSGIGQDVQVVSLILVKRLYVLANRAIKS